MVPQQLYAEIQIHKSVSQGGNSHVNVLNFLDWFEDRDNVYMMVELCHKGVRSLPLPPPGRRVTCCAALPVRCRDLSLTLRCMFVLALRLSWTS